MYNEGEWKIMKEMKNNERDGGKECNVRGVNEIYECKVFKEKRQN